MPKLIKQAEFDFLRGLDSLALDNATQAECATRLGVAEGTITYRLNKHSLTFVRGGGLFDPETREWFVDKVKRGAYELPSVSTPQAEVTAAV